MAATLPRLRAIPLRSPLPFGDPMKLFNPESAGHFIYAVLPKTAREGTAPSYQAIAGTSFDDCEQRIERNGSRSVYPYPMGRYDDKGRYETYRPGIEGVRPGIFTIHPLAAEEEKTYERDLMYRRHGGHQ